MHEENSTNLLPLGNLKPSYLLLAESGELSRRARLASNQLGACTLCGWKCEIDRRQELGPCRTGTECLVSSSYLHLGEERPLVGQSGSGAIFFSNCDLRCQFCQTYRWNILGKGVPVSNQQLGELMVSLQSRGAVNINLVTPTHVLPQIMLALEVAVGQGLTIPLVWNSGGYDSLDALALLDGIVDIFLPDMKFSDSRMAMQLSGIRDYPRVNQLAVKAMHDMVGSLLIDSSGIARRGVLVRHLVMPSMAENTRAVLDWIAENLGTDTYLSLMDQYRPAYRAMNRRNINRALDPEEFQQAKLFALSLGFHRMDDSHVLATA